MTIKVLGPGCANCKTLAHRTREAMDQLNLSAPLEKIEDIPGMMAYGIMATPALVIDEKVVSQGRVLTVEAIKDLIQRGR
jgi:small redox-active disulfide protein 2